MGERERAPQFRGLHVVITRECVGEGIASGSASEAEINGIHKLIEPIEHHSSLTNRETIVCVCVYSLAHCLQQRSGAQLYRFESYITRSDDHSTGHVHVLSSVVSRVVWSPLSLVAINDSLVKQQTRTKRHKRET